jgi:hypothetical protein
VKKEHPATMVPKGLLDRQALMGTTVTVANRVLMVAMVRRGHKDQPEHKGLPGRRDRKGLLAISPWWVMPNCK